MLYELKDIQRDVRIALNLNEISDALLNNDDVDTLMVDELIRSKVEDAAQKVELEAPVHMLDSGSNFADEIYWDDDDHNSGWTILPDDFWKLIMFQMSDWKKAVYATITHDDPDYSKQKSDFVGIRGNCSNPVCAIVMRSEGKVLEFYSCKSKEATVIHAVYLKKPELDEYDCIRIDERCYRAVIYYCAGLVAQAVGKEDANNYFELSKGFIE